MKRCWKPLDVLGMRFYRVFVHWPNPVGYGRGTTQQVIVAASSPSDAARIMSAHYANLSIERRPRCNGEALNVCQPVEWVERSQVVSPLDCKHERRTTLQSGSGSCADGKGGVESWREHVSLCLACGQIEVNATKNGQHFNLSFGLTCDQDLIAAANYMRSDAEARDVIERRNRLTEPTQSPKVAE